ncbi:MAG: hypothetical protein E7339_01475 [Clostridiales bacterium]|nr:hypothetical protein [Clostridiales bacterium]
MSELGIDERTEYQEILDRLKSEFKNKIKSIIEQEKREMAKEAANILGRDFANLVSERRKLTDAFSIESKKVLNFAIKIGQRDKITELSKLTKDRDENADIKSKATTLFGEILQVVQEFDSELIKSLRLIEAKLDENNKKMTALVNLKKKDIEQVEKNYKQKLQKILIEIVLDFNKRIAVINKEFGIENSKPFIPFDDGESSEKLTVGLEEDLNDGFFIPTDSDDVN